MKYNIILTFFLIGIIFLILFYERKKKIKYIEHFRQCPVIDESIFCIDKEEDNLHKFRKNMDENYNKVVPNQELYNNINQSLNYKNIDNLKNKIKNNTIYDINYLKTYFDTYFKKYIVVNDDDDNERVKFKYSNIPLINPLDVEKMSNQLNKSLVSPGGVIFDEDNDDIIVFDIYRIRRFQFRDLRVRDKVQQIIKNIFFRFLILIL